MYLWKVILEKLTNVDSYTYCPPFTNDQSFQNRNKTVSYITFGHFDTIHICYPVSNVKNNVFEQIHDLNQELDDYQSESRHYSPMYFLSEDGDRNYSTEDLMRYPFISVSKLHLRSSFLKNSDSDRFEKELSAYLDKINKKDRNLKYILLQTTELSDFALLMFSESFCDLSETALSLRLHFDFIGKMYSHFGISIKKLEESNWQPLHENEKVGLFEMRFSAKDYSKAMTRINEATHMIGETQLYSVAGVDDFWASWRDLPINKIINYLRLMYINQNLDLSSLADMVTRIGASIGSFSQEISPEKQLAKVNNPLVEKCKNLHDRFKKKKEADQLDQFSWSNQFDRLLKLLANIGQTVELDEILCIVIESVEAFIRNIEEMRVITVEQNERCQLFVEGLESLLEHTIRYERQLVHDPQLYPIIHDIPLVIFEYYLSFIREYVETIQEIDHHCNSGKDPNYKVDFLVVPKQCTQANTVEIFHSSNINNGVVLIEFPSDSMHQIQRNLRTLGHEVAHFSGDICRKRDVRKECYLKAASIAIGATCFENCDSGFISVIEENLRGVNGDNIFLNDLHEKTINWFYNIQNDLVAYNDLFKNGLLKCEGNEVSILAKYSELDNDQIESCIQTLDTIRFLFSEIYADLFMLSLLRPKLQDYVADQLDEYLRDSIFSVRVTIAIRLSISLKQVGELHDLESLKRKTVSALQKRYPNVERVKIQDLVYDLFRKMESTLRLLENPASDSYGTIIELIHVYTQACYKDLNKYLSIHSTDPTFSSYKNSVSNYSVIKENIYNHREKLAKSMGNLPNNN